MNVMALLEYLDEELSKSATVPLTGKRLVDVEKCLDIVSELRVTLPDDVKDAVAKADEEADSCTAYLNDVLGNVEQHLKRVLDDVHQNRLEVTSGGDGGNNAARSGR